MGAAGGGDALPLPRRAACPTELCSLHGGELPLSSLQHITLSCAPSSAVPPQVEHNIGRLAARMEESYRTQLRSLRFRWGQGLLWPQELQHPTDVAFQASAWAC